MKRLGVAVLGIALLGLALHASEHQPASQPATAPSPIASHPASLRSDTGMSADAQTALVKQFCTPCHNDRMKTGNLSLATFDAATASGNAVVAERMIRKLRLGMMPPPGVKRPDEATLAGLASALEAHMDHAAELNPNPGSRPFQRLNRAEYARAVKDLLALDVDVHAFLPPDTISQGFDTVADVQTFSPTLLEGYLRAASRVAALAVGDAEAEPAEAHYRVPKTASQRSRVDGAPAGTRGGVSVVHAFAADGDYVFRVDLHGNADGFLFGGPATGEQIEISIDGERKALLDVDPRMAEATTSLTLKTPPLHVRAGSHRVTAAFIQRFEGPVNDLIAPIDHTLADTQIGVAHGITTLPHLKELSIVGPQRVTGVSDTVSRRRIFICRPTAPGEERACAKTIVTRLARQAFRRPVTDADAEGLMRFYDEGRKVRDFEYGVASALEAILASPDFLFRLEAAPQTSGQRAPVADLELASRLSYFLWGTGPDEELLKVARQRQLGTPAVLEAQVRRMLADPRSEALATRFAAQWLRLHDVDLILPDAILYPYFDRTLGDAFIRETELFFDSLVREDRPLLDLLTADYTFVNERIARHYGIPNVTGNEFRRVSLPDNRRGILGHGSVLVLTSVADRTSPVMRGKWIMEVLLGSPPPPPPPNVPALEETKAAAAGKLLTVRERMEEHRKNPACASCHRVIDPLGLALENYDVTGRWRIKDNGVEITPSGVLYDGTTMEGPAGLRNALLKHKDAFVLSFTESLMTYAVGRRVEAHDMPVIRRILRDAATKDYKMSAFVLGIVNSAPFRMSQAAAAPTVTTDRQ
jgi:hypothetical protein